MNFIDLAGERFGRLVAVSHDRQRQPSGRVKVMWHCKCDCGSESLVPAFSLRSGETKSCGCLRKEGKPPRHGFSKKGQKETEYIIWCSMKDRCQNPKNKFFYRYGERGIRVCDRWQRFDNFLEDMGRRPSPTHTLDRIDNDGSYELANCRWATPREQALNRSRGTRRCRPADGKNL